MTFREIATALGVETYPEALEQYYEAEPKVNICDLELIDRLQKEYDLFGEYYDDVVRGAKAVAESPVHLAWGSTVAAYNMAAKIPAEMTKVPTPETDGTPAGDMMPLLQLIPLIPGSVEEYRRRGFDDETIYVLLRTYQGGVRTVHRRVGRPGLNRTYYNWNCLYTKAMLFKYGGFNFEVKKMPSHAIYLKNRQDGTLIPVMQKGTFHASGMVLDSAGFEDPTGSFDADFAETDEYFYGHRSVNGFVSPEAEYFKKSEWECVLRGGEDMVGVHIPRGTDMTDPAVDAAFTGVMDIMRKYYPEFNVKGLVCSSWLLDPTLKNYVKEGSKIVAFGNRFNRYPSASKGKEVFSFVFIDPVEDLNDLPENTTLERNLKKLYLSGGAVHAFAGVIL